MKRATKLTCNQVRFYSETFTAEQLDANLAAAVQRHLSECTDCRVQHHRTRRVVALLQLKRHEQPPPSYFENFLTEFHQRLAASQPTGWRAVWARFTEPTALSPAWKWAASGACAAVVLMGLMWFNVYGNRAIPAGAEVQPMRVAPRTLAIAAPSPAPTISPAVALEEAAREAEFADTLSLASSLPVRNPPTTPRYVLDRIPVTTVGFEARADF